MVNTPPAKSFIWVLVITNIYQAYNARQVLYSVPSFSTLNILGDGSYSYIHFQIK